MPIRITVTVDDERQRQSGADEQDPAQIMDLIAALRDDGRLSLQSRSYWLPVRDLKVRPAA
jgi:hypothetical protein